MDLAESHSSNVKVDVNRSLNASYAVHGEFTHDMEPKLRTGKLMGVSLAGVKSFGRRR